MMDINDIERIDGCIIFNSSCNKELQKSILDEVSKIDVEFSKIEITAGEDLFILKEELVEIADNEYRKIYSVEKAERIEFSDEFGIVEN